MAENKFESLYPDYDVLAKWNTPSWNEQTRAVVAKRLHEVPSRQFFDELQFTTLEAVCDCVMPQPEREAKDKVPIAPWIDDRLQKNTTNGTRYPPLPPQRECWKRGMDAIGAEAQARFRRSFRKLDPAEQDILLHAIDHGDVQAPDWGKLPPRMFMRKALLREIVEVYYAHPAAWSEIGFGGPASPRGYLRLSINRRDPWEGEEHANDVLREAAAKRELIIK
jgi:Gluconate 2-dehydrogenase subunit 3